MKYLTIALANQTYGLELSHVKEWLGYMPFCAGASADPAIIGTFDYRGQVIDVIDLRMQFNLAVTRTDLTSMVVVEVSDKTFALIVDHVLSIRDPAAPSGLNEKPFIPIDLIGNTKSPGRDSKIAA